MKELYRPNQESRKIEDPQIKDNKNHILTHDQVFKLIEKKPGLKISQIAQSLKMNLNKTYEYINNMQKLKLIQSESPLNTKGKYYFPTNFHEGEEKEIIRIKKIDEIKKRKKEWEANPPSGDKNIYFIHSIRKEIKKKYPKKFKLFKREIINMRRHTANVKNKYTEYDNFKKYAQETGSGEVLILDQRRIKMRTLPLFNLSIIEEAYLPKLEKIRDFAPDFYDSAMKHTFGNIKEEISGHEKEYSKDLALKVYPKILEMFIKGSRALSEIKIAEVIMSANELKKLHKKADFYAESQRILKHSKSAKDITDAIAIPHVFWKLLDSGIENTLKTEITKKNFMEQLSASPDENSVKGLYPYLIGDVIADVVNKMEYIRKYLKERYENKYGKIPTENAVT